MRQKNRYFVNFINRYKDSVLNKQISIPDQRSLTVPEIQMRYLVWPINHPDREEIERLYKQHFGGD